jgi:hypothetical protein
MKMKKRTLLMLAGLAVFSLAGTQASAFTVEDDMAEGFSLSSTQDNTEYKYDSLHADAKESMTEFDFFPVQTENHDNFIGDSSCPSMHELMNEGICLDSLKRAVATK